MSRHWSFKVASWIYFGIASLFLLALAAGPYFTGSAVTTRMIAAGAAVALVVAALAVWSRRVYLVRSQPTKIFYTCSLLLFVLFGALSPGYSAYVLFGPPTLLVALGMREVELAKRRGAISGQHDD